MNAVTTVKTTLTDRRTSFKTPGRRRQTYQGASIIPTICSASRWMAC